VTRLNLIAKHYLKGFFFVDLMACLPWSYVVGSGGSKDRVVNTAFRILRIQRVWRLMQLTKLKPLLRFLGEIVSQHPISKQILGLRGVRLMSLFCMVMLIVHILACGWYLCAALEAIPEESWVGRRVVDDISEVTLLEKEAWLQWLHAVYFVVTTFTTVGFGDIHGQKPAELVYAGGLMMLGTIINAMVMGNVLNILTGVDRMEDFFREQDQVVQDFASHARLDSNIKAKLSEWASRSASSDSRFDKVKMTRILESGAIPSSVLEMLPPQLFEGRLIHNNLLIPSSSVMLDVPPRLPVLLAISMTMVHLKFPEIVYSMYEMPQHLYLVHSGTFAHVGLPTPQGGVDCAAREREEYSPALSSLGASQGPNRSTNRKPAMELFPYRLCSARSYFGDSEIFAGNLRTSTTRCESQKGELLIINKLELQSLMVDFPRFLHLWRFHSFRRETARLHQLVRLKRPRTSLELAAFRLQRFYRKRKRGSLRRAEALPPLLEGKVSRMGSDLEDLMQHHEGGVTTPVAAIPTPPTQLEQSTRVLKEVQSLRSDVDSLRSDFRALLQEIRASRSDDVMGI